MAMRTREDGFSVIPSLLVASVALRMSLYVAGVQVKAAGLPPQDKGLTRHYYTKHNTCENVEAFVKHQLKIFWGRDKSITAKFFKLLYSDCMVNGCDASILLDGPRSEKTSPANAGLGGFEVIDKIKIVFEDRCPGAVSCADILKLATRDAAHLAGAPSYPVMLGRKDGVESDAVWVDLPSPSISWQLALTYFESKGLNVQDLATLLVVPSVVISRAHTMGRTHCNYINDRLYNFKNTRKPDPSMEKSTISYLRKLCPPKLSTGQSDPMVYLNTDNGPRYCFNNSYYSRVLAHKSVLGVDQQLHYGNATYQQTQEYAAGFEEFRKEFAFSISLMGGLRVSTGDNGEIRQNCRMTNKNNPNF